MSSHHALILTDRGVIHRHRFTPACACGKWFGRHHRRRCDAAREYRGHLAANTATARSSRAGVVVPLPLTPAERLPAELRT